MSLGTGHEAWSRAGWRSGFSGGHWSTFLRCISDKRRSRTLLPSLRPSQHKAEPDRNLNPEGRNRIHEAAVVFTADPVVCFSCSSGGVLFGRAVGRFPRRCQTRFESGCSSPAHSPSSRLVQRVSRCRSLSKARLDIFYVGDVGFLRTTLIIYLFIPLLSCDSANILHESAQLALKFMFLYCSPFALKFLSQPFFLCVCVF